MKEKYRRYVAWALAGLGIALAGVSWAVLPDTAVVQWTAIGPGNTLPKPLAVLLGLALTTGFSLAYRFDTTPRRGRYLFLSLVGVAVFILILIFNCGLLSR